MLDLRDKAAAQRAELPSVPNDVYHLEDLRRQTGKDDAMSYGDLSRPGLIDIYFAAVREPGTRDTSSIVTFGGKGELYYAQSHEVDTDDPLPPLAVSPTPIPRVSGAALQLPAWQRGGAMHGHGRCGRA